MTLRIACGASLIFAVLGCAGGEFAGSGEKKSDPKPAAAPSPADNPTPTSGGQGKDAKDGGEKSGKDAKDGADEGGLGNETDAAAKDGKDGKEGGEDGDLFTDDEQLLAPKACNGTNQVQIAVGKECPRNFALYTMDDMSSSAQVPGQYVCCALPSGDILSKTKTKINVKRNRRCGANEIMTGAVDTAGNIFCTAINDQKYGLQPAKLVCAGEKGALFGIGGKDCGGSSEVVDKNTLPATLSALVIGPLGEDGCVTVPHGSLVIQQGGRRCEDSAASTLVLKAGGGAVKIFP